MFTFTSGCAQLHSPGIRGPYPPASSLFLSPSSTSSELLSLPSVASCTVPIPSASPYDANPWQPMSSPNNQLALPQGNAVPRTNRSLLARFGNTTHEHEGRSYGWFRLTDSGNNALATVCHTEQQVCCFARRPCLLLMFV